MVLVDYREDEKHPDIARNLQKAGLTADVTTLDFGDVAFTGRGHGDVPVFVGIELKRLTTSDAVDSIRSGRLADHQLHGMVGENGIYEYGFLVIEGQYRANGAGQLLVFNRRGWTPVQGGMTVSTLEKSLLTYRFSYPKLTVWPTNRPEDTVAFLVNLYRWFCDKPMDAHTSHLAMHQPPGILPLSDFRATLMARCPGMGRSTTLAAEKQFNGDLRKAVLAPAEVWAGITTTDRRGKTKRLGLKRAQEIVAFWHGKTV